MVHSADIHFIIELLHLKARQGLRVCSIYVLNFFIVILYCILLCMSSEDPFCMYTLSFLMFRERWCAGV